MRILLNSIVIFFIFSCSHLREISKKNKKTKPISSNEIIQTKVKKSKNVKTTYSFQDTTGSYYYDRELLLKNRRVFFESGIKDTKDSKSLEKTKIITDIKFDKMGRRLSKEMIPVISQYSTWFDGKEYKSQIELKQDGSIKMHLGEAFEGHDRYSQYSYQTDAKNCFFSMIPECLKFWNVFEKLNDQKNKFSFNIIWENYPFNKKIYSNAPKSIVSEAYVVYEGIKNERYIYSVVVDEKNMSYQFDQFKRFIAFFWVSEGLSLSKKKL